MSGGLISRTYSFSDAVPLVNSHLESEIANIVDTINNADKGLKSWSNIVMATSPSAGVISVKSPAALLFTSLDGTLTTNVKYVTNTFEVTPDTTNGFFVNGNAAIAKVHSPQYQSGSGVLFLDDAQALPSSNTTAGVIVYSDGQILKYRGANGVKVLGTTTLQTVSATNTSVTTNSTTSYAATGLTASIKPSSASSKIKITAFGSLTANSAVAAALVTAYATIYRGASTNLSSDDLARGFNYNSGQTGIYPVTMVITDSPATTSSTSYTVQIKSGDTNQVAWGGTLQTIILEEIQ